MKIITDEIKADTFVRSNRLFRRTTPRPSFPHQTGLQRNPAKKLHSALITFPTHPRQVMQSSYVLNGLLVCLKRQLSSSKRKRITASCYHLPKNCHCFLHVSSCNYSENVLMSVFWLLVMTIASGTTAAEGFD